MNSREAEYRITSYNVCYTKLLREERNHLLVRQINAAAFRAALNDAYAAVGLRAREYR